MAFGNGTGALHGAKRGYLAEIMAKSGEKLMDDKSALKHHSGPSLAFLWSTQRFERWLYVAFATLSILWVVGIAGVLQELMDIYAGMMLILVLGLHLFLAKRWPSWRVYSLGVGVFSLLGIFLYGNDLLKGEQVFLLKYFLSSQAAIIWMITLAFLAAFLLNIAWISKKSGIYPWAYGLYWISALLGLVALMVRWRESYLIAPDVGHIPVSNLYEVFVLFNLMMILMLLYYRRQFNVDAAGACISWAICLALGFMVWYILARDAQVIQPLIPALQSWWMKIHVPANFVGYGAFSMAAMLGIYYLITQDERIESWMYQIIALGFLFFTLATLLGAMWAAEAWGSYWSWDPKETWALIVWLNYAAWLHIRLVKGWQGKVLAWWAIMGFLITAFAFIGVNQWLAGLHSYGTL
jgi:ABC-type transport system involved in cytochrome c biogenesis permease subunit